MSARCLLSHLHRTLLRIRDRLAGVYGTPWRDDFDLMRMVETYVEEDREKAVVCQEGDLVAL